jgi:leucyl/phenylalanyl-tRNA--protein transferase
MEITSDLLLSAYANGLFPMAETAESEELFWMDPPERCIIPLDAFHVPSRLARTVRQDRFRLTVNQAFRDVMVACAAKRPNRPKTWINKPILDLYCALHARGHAHSMEAWHDDKLVGGLYGVSLGTAFFGESMFSLERDASKVVLVHLVARLKRNGFTLLDAQFENEHLNQFNAKVILREDYQRFLGAALAGGVASFAAGGTVEGSGGGAITSLQSSTHTS